MAKEIDVKALRDKAKKARQRNADRNKVIKESQERRIETEARERAERLIEEIPELLERVAKRGGTRARVFHYDVRIGGGDYEGTAIDERIMQLVDKYCRDQGLQTERSDGNWNSEVIREYVLEVIL